MQSYFDQSCGSIRPQLYSFLPCTLIWPYFSRVHLSLAIFQQGAPCFGHCPYIYMYKYVHMSPPISSPAFLSYSPFVVYAYKCMRAWHDHSILGYFNLFHHFLFNVSYILRSIIYEAYTLEITRHALENCKLSVP